ncbi:coiled-coil domain-containing protein R3HCC1L [Thalassophryne amazonica]|uniref:coiled-coil domain-containing protein R3HCC1L n=1 Tax=Thalassophryne amazonica TaxID=390379 RepID=UPI0014709BF4|nr:coiled-coil domain-containing protein R3HCC1L [Thalassophryne amazonica]
MELREERAQMECSASSSFQPRRPDQVLDRPKDRVQNLEELKQQTRTRYRDKTWKNAKNKRDKSEGAHESEGVHESVAVRRQSGGEWQSTARMLRTTQDQIHDVAANGQQNSSSVEVITPETVSTVVQQQDLASSREDESWDTLFNDDGECLDPHLLEELALKDGQQKESIQEPRFDYYTMDPGEDDDLNLREDELSHIIEIYDFPSEFKTEDLLKLFQSYQRRGFDIKWIDDTHVLGLFSSPMAAREVLRSKHPLLKVRPLSKSPSATRTKARSCTDYLLPTKDRPQTSAVLARKLVVGALGIKSNQTKEQREAERRKLHEAREQKATGSQTERRCLGGEVNHHLSEL